MQIFENSSLPPIPEYLNYSGGGNSFAIKITDSDMAPALPVGCTAVVERTGTVEDGDIVLVIFRGQLLLRRLHGDPFGNLYLLRDDTDQPGDSIFIRAAEVDEMICLGRVTEILP